MRFIPTWMHGMLDYPMAILLIALPWLGGFADGGPEQWIPMIAGVAMLGLSAMTSYEAGLVRAVPMPVHLAVDVAMGLFLTISPWLFGFAAEVYLPFLILGIAEAAAGLMTETSPARRLAGSAV
jgi:hypothetical protein